MRALPLRNSPMWFGLNGVHKIRKLMRILDKKDRRVITDEIENSLFGIKFGRKTADITYGISRPRAACTVEKRTKTGVIFCGSHRNAAFVMSLRSLYGWK
ncbi:Uncharacterised protein [Salmonella enterica subsp. enterica]|uniref:Uncharacterized protein n=1 Tax=Salmonella enterica I TaxID=59201 RepID=A0A379WA50_SALET|nr:Uncharacterised protein [Salmonella enterica subsp. enterica]